MSLSKLTAGLAGLTFGLTGYRSAASAWNPNSLAGLVFAADWNTAKYDDSVASPTPSDVVTADGATVTWWADSVAAHFLKSHADAEMGLLRPTGGPSTGKAAVEWNSSSVGMFNASGSSIVAGSSLTMAVIAKVPAGGVANGLMGRGGYLGDGTFIEVNASNLPYAEINAGSKFDLAGAVAVSNAWDVYVFTYDGVTARFLPGRGNAVVSQAVTGALSFNGGDTAFWAGGRTSNGSGFVNSNPKFVAANYVWTSGLSSDAAVTALANNIATYAGLGSFIAPVLPTGATHRYPLNSTTLNTDTIGGLNGTSSGVTRTAVSTVLNGSAYVSLPSCPLPIGSAHSGIIAFKITTPANLGGGGFSQSVLGLTVDGNNWLRLAIDSDSVNPAVGLGTTASFVVALHEGGVSRGLEVNASYPSFGVNAVIPGIMMRVGWTTNGSGAVKLYLNGIPVPGAQTFADSGFGAAAQNTIGTLATAGNGAVTGAAAEFITWSRVLTDAEMAQADKVIAWTVLGKQNRLNLVVVGASNISDPPGAGTGVASCAAQTVAALAGGIGYSNLAIGGQTLTYFDTNFNTAVAVGYNANADINLLLVQDYNDYPALTAAQIYAVLQSICTKWKALGSNTAIALASGWNYDYSQSSALIASYAAFSSLVQAGIGTTGNYYCNNLNLVGLNTGTGPTNPTYVIQDPNNHLTLAGNTLVATGTYIPAVAGAWS